MRVEAGACVPTALPAICAAEQVGARGSPALESQALPFLLRCSQFVPAALECSWSCLEPDFLVLPQSALLCAVCVLGLILSVVSLGLGHRLQAPGWTDGPSPSLSLFSASAGILGVGTSLSVHWVLQNRGIHRSKSLSAGVAHSLVSGFSGSLCRWVEGSHGSLWREPLTQDFFHGALSVPAVLLGGAVSGQS